MSQRELHTGCVAILIQKLLSETVRVGKVTTVHTQPVFFLVVFFLHVRTVVEFRSTVAPDRRQKTLNALFKLLLMHFSFIHFFPLIKDIVYREYKLQLVKWRTPTYQFDEENKMMLPVMGRA